MAIRAIMYGLGRVNRLATRLLLEKGVHVVAAVTRPGPKVGCDLGEVAEIGRTLDVVVTDDPEIGLSVTADIVMVGVHDDFERMTNIFRHCLSRGLNVLSVGAHHSYPWRMAPEWTRELDSLAKANGVTISASGNQDLFMINLPAMMSGVCHRIEAITHRSLSNVNNFGAEVAHVAHVGLTREEFDTAAKQPRPSVYTTFWENLAAALNFEVLDVRQADEAITASEPRFCHSLDREIEAGRVIGTRTSLNVETDTGPVMQGHYDLQVCEQGEEEFKAWKITGEPELNLRLKGLDSGFLTTSQYVNRIAHVIDAAPGYVTLEQIPKLVYQPKVGG